jgi:hypothetical protein
MDIPKPDAFNEVYLYEGADRVIKMIVILI